MHSNSITTEVIKPTLKQFTYIIKYNSNSNSNSNNNAKFIDIDLSCNKLNIRLLANNFITRIEKRHVLETKNEAKINPQKLKPFGKKKYLLSKLAKKGQKY